MPTYDYKCNACGHAFERFQSITSPPVTKCPECGRNKVKRLLGTGAGLIFKGSGFYITDYRDSGYKEAAKKDSGSSDASASSSSSSGDSAKPAAAESKPAAAKKAENRPSSQSGDKKK